MKIYIDLFITGVALSWGPCFSFCAPILLPFIAATQKGWRAGLRLSLAFSLARVVSYAALGLVSATLGGYLITRFYQTAAGLTIYLVIGALITLLGVFVLIGRPVHLSCCPAVKRRNLGGIKEMVLLGLVVGLAPCLPLFGVLAYIALHAQNFLQGLSLGLAFGAGTLISPLILVGALTGTIPVLLDRKAVLHKVFSRLCGLILIYLGTGMIVRALQ